MIVKMDCQSAIAAWLRSNDGTIWYHIFFPRFFGHLPQQVWQSTFRFRLTEKAKEVLFV
jgi:hypothetical protein